MQENRKSETRKLYGEKLLELAEKDKNIVALDCDLGRSTQSFMITEIDTERFFEMGIAEQDMISTAAGLAKMGKIPFANSFAVFITGRAFDQIRQQVALPKLNVKICGSSGGLTHGPDGATHQAVLDLGLMRLLPNMTVINPADGNQTKDVVQAAYDINGPVYIRLSRFSSPDVVPFNCKFVTGKAQKIKDGGKVALCGIGPLISEVVKAASILEEEGISTAVYNFHTLKPFDAEAVKSMMNEFEYIFSVEEHNIIGALGSAISEVLSESSEKGSYKGFKRIGINDCFGESGTAVELLKKHKLDADGISGIVKQITE